MAEIVLFHHVRGLTEGVEFFAEQLRARGHRVDTPDYFEGRTFGTVDEGIAYARDVGFDVIRRRALETRAGMPVDVVYGGFSLGVMTAQSLLLTTPEARGGILMHGFAPLDELGLRWRDDVPVQMHAMDADPWVVEDGDLAAARAVGSVHGNLEVHTYPGSGHLFTDRSDADYDAEATALLLERIGGLLETIDAAARAD